MEKHYFIGEGPEAEELIAVARKKELAVWEARRAVVEDYDADGLMESVWRDGSVTGLAFITQVKRPYLKGETKLANDEGYGYYPKKSTKEGKKLAKRLEEENMKFKMSNFIIEFLNLERAVTGPAMGGSRYGYRIYYSVAGIVRNKVLVSIPGSKDPEKCKDTFPVIPEWMREVKESEWLAAQGR